MTKEESPTNLTDPISPPPGTSQQLQQTPDAQGELTAAVDDLLDQLKHKFDVVSGEMFSKLDDMTRRLDELEASLTVSADAGSARATPTPAGSRSGSGTGMPV
ncbi:hypothetical protein PHISP_06236 [Aspergillus sp. HF37]|nr:hypothetical protein PHISP_06236 [Aspergillus sp. HF37]